MGYTSSSVLDWKQSVRAASTGDLVLNGTQTVDTVALVAGDRILVKDQTLGEQNGIYQVQAAAWNRAADANVSNEVTNDLTVEVEEGSQAGTAWRLSTPDPILLGTTVLTFVPFGAGVGLGDNNVWTGSNEFQGAVLVTSGSFVAGDAALGTATLFAVRETADVASRLQIHADGSFHFGDGTGATDTSLARTGVNELTTGNFVVSGGAGTALKFNGDGEIDANFGASATTYWLKGGAAADAQPRIRADRSGLFEWGGGAGLPDTNLYRSAANTLKTDTIFVVGAGFRALGLASFFDNLDAVSGTSQLLFQAQSLASNVVVKFRVTPDPFDSYNVWADGTQEWGDGAGALDVSQARTGVGELTITGNLIVTGDVTSNGSITNGTVNLQSGASYIGSAPSDVLSFYGVTAVAQQAAPVTLGDVITVLQNLGLTA